MRKPFILPLAALLAAAGLCIAQSPAPDGSAPAPPVGMPGVYPPSYGPAVSPDTVDPMEDPALRPPPPPPPGGPFDNALWVNVDYLLWKFKDNQLPPLLTAGSATAPHPGGLGQPGTSILYGGGNVSEALHSGVRLQAGYWFTDNHSFGLDANVFYLGGSPKSFAATSSGTPILAVPFYNTAINAQTAIPLSAPKLLAAGYNAALGSNLWGYDSNIRTALWHSEHLQVCLLGGFRFINLQETLETTAGVTPTTTPSSGLATFIDSRFNTRNLFYGGQVGAEVSCYFYGFTLDLTGKVAVGDVCEIAGITGTTQIVGLPTPTPLVYPTGLLTAPSNNGRYSHNAFAWAPEAGLTLGYQITRHLRATLGYNFLYLSRAVRPGNTIDSSVNPTVTANALLGTPVSGAARPSYPNMDSSFWAQGLTAGLEFRY
jgi:hypothetical protein